MEAKFDGHAILLKMQAEASLNIAPNPCRAPTVSVLMPVFNGGRHLAAAIESILDQSYRDFEFLILDDGSTDASREVIERYARRDGRIRWIGRENRGLVSTLNELVVAARGELLARMDADDLALPDRLSQQVAFMQDHPAVVCVGGGYTLIDEEGRRITTHSVLLSNADIQSQALRGHTTICHPCALLRKAAVVESGGYRPEFFPAEDLDLWLRLGEIGELANLPSPMILYRTHAGSISGKSAQGRQREAARRCCEDAWRRRQVTGIVFEAGAPWRPDATRRSRHGFHMLYGWWAFQSGERATAVHYAWLAIRCQPWHWRGWHLLGVALIKSPEVAKVGQ